MAVVDDEQQFCLRWNNFQANITSQFEALRDDEDFTDVTIACEGQRIQAHKVVLSACSPFFKELFKSNPCSHPIIFMRDVEACDILSLMEFMYAGEVNVAQSHLSAFLKTAESLKIRGLTDTSTGSAQLSTVATGQGPSKKLCKSDSSEQPQPEGFEGPKGLQPKMEAPECLGDIEIEDLVRENEVGEVVLEAEVAKLPGGMEIIPQSSSGYSKEMKQEASSYQGRDSRKLHSLDPRPCEECGKVYSNLSNLRQHMRLIHYPTFVQCNYCQKPFKTDLYLRRHVMSAHGIPHADSNGSTNKTYMKYYEFSKGMKLRMRRSSERFLPFNSPHQSDTEGSPELSPILQHRPEGERRNRLIKLAEGIEIYEDQLRSVKWSDYRKLTRGLATILFSPAELATCSVTGQRWSRAGNGERPVKPALDRTKVQAIISYVATQFPMVEISRIKQVLAYKCKENSTAFKMKAVRYYGEQFRK